MNTEILYYALIFLAGVGLGLLYFGGLWLTVKLAMKSNLSGLLFSVSFPIRLLLVGAGFYFVSNGDWKKLLACAVGFLLTRTVLIYYLRPEHLTATHQKEEKSDGTQS